MLKKFLRIFKKEKCPVCQMELEEGKDYPAEDGKKFCSPQCQEKYKKDLAKEQSGNKCSCC